MDSIIPTNVPITDEDIKKSKVVYKEENTMGDMSSMSPSDVAAVLGNHDSNDYGSGSAFWIFALIALMGGFGGWNNRGYNSQYATQDFVQNGFNFNDLQDQNRDLMSAVTSGTAQAVAATNQAEYEQIAVAKDAQYQLQQSLNNLGLIAQNNQANENECCCKMLRAIDNVNYNNAMNTASINANTTAQTQKILDKMSENEIAGLRAQVNSLQNQLNAVGTVKYPMSSAYTAGPNPFCQPCGCNM